MIPVWMIWVQCICFSALYAIWALPETILIRHICLIVGALIGLYEVYQYRRRFFQRRAIPAWLLLGLFVWMTFHLIFLSNDFALQYQEYTTIWKRTALGALFAIGWGLALANTKLSPKVARSLWVLVYLGLLAPTFIYIVKYVLTHYGVQKGWLVPEYWKLHYGSLPFYLPKTAYVCFCLPTLGIALGQLARNISRHKWLHLANVIYLATVPAVIFVFYGDNIKNGVIYSAVLIAVFIASLIFSEFHQRWLLKSLFIAVILGSGIFFLANHIQKNDSWRTFQVDAKVALNTDQYQQWKYNGAQGYPNNELGVVVSPTNYDRIAWGKEGIKLIWRYPLGYGLIERSFGHLGKIAWPDSILHQSHSGWIDLALGIGIPGIVLILTSLLTLLYPLGRLANPNQGLHLSESPYQSMAWWALFSLLIMWCTTEISQKVFFDSFIFWLSLGAGLSLGYPEKKRFAHAEELAKVN